MIRHQSYTATNFCKIFYRENRKGNFLEANFEIFKPLRMYTKLIQSINNKFNQKQHINEQKKYKANLLKDKLKQKKYETLLVILHEIEKNILDRKYDLSLVQGTINKKTVYQLDSTDPTIYFLLKQLQYNLRQAFNISMSDRHSIVSQVISLVADNFPKILIKADISQFYESVPHEKLLKKILNNVNLNIKSKQIINSLLDSYKSVSGQAVGILRGIGISAFLSELYMQDIDEQIKNLPDLTYFARYVDDIVMIFTPSAQVEKQEEKYFIEFENIISKNLLTLNKDKTKKISLKEKINIDFLGYTISNNNNELKVELSKKSLTDIKIKLTKRLRIMLRLQLISIVKNKHANY